MPPRVVRLDHPADPVAWREAARTLLAEAVAPERVIWQADEAAPGGGDDLFAAAAEAVAANAAGGPASLPAVPAARVPRAFPALVADVVCHRDPRRFALLYRVLWRLVHGERGLLDDHRDGDVHTLEALARAVRRDRHKMTAFVRFRRLPDDVPGGPGGPDDGPGDPGDADAPERYAAWFEPEHRIVRSTADFFARRFATMAFAIFTPEESVHWDTRSLAFGPGATRRAVPGVEPVEALWREYYANIFNPARLKLGAMRAEMPVKYWKNLPEADLIGPLAREAHRRAGAMIEAGPTSAPGFAVRAGLVADPAAGDGGREASGGAFGRASGGASGGGAETRPDPHSGDASRS